MVTVIITTIFSPFFFLKVLLFTTRHAQVSKHDGRRLKGMLKQQEMESRPTKDGELRILEVSRSRVNTFRGSARVFG